MKHSFALVFASTSLVVACGGSDGQGTKVATSHPTPGACSETSGFAGDDLCIAPPSAAQGIQLHVGPTSYDDMDAMEPFIIAPGDENVRCFLARVPEGGFYYFKQEARMRSGSHHMLIDLIPDTGQAEGPTDKCEVIGSLGSIPGSQTPIRNFPDGEVAPEDEGLARYLPEGAMASFQLHYVNLGTEPNLREAWVNLYKKDESEVTQRLQTVFMVGDISVNIPPQTRQTTTLEFTPTLPSATRVYTLNGHSHAHSESFTVWRTRGDQKDMIYQSFNWAEPDVLTYNTVVQNKLPDAVAKTDGGSTGLLTLEPGDKLTWSCDVNNTLDTAIHFANEAHTAEMCLLAGAYVSDDPKLLAGACFSGKCNAGFPAGIGANIDGR
jgi:hypothetical protein